MLHVMNAPSHGQSVPLNPTGRCSRLYPSKNSHSCQLGLKLKASGSFSGSSWVESFVRQSKFSFFFCDAVEVQRGTRFWWGDVKGDSFWKESDNSRCLSDCSLVRVLIISSTKWETLKTDKSTTSYVLWSLEAGHTDNSPC